MAKKNTGAYCGSVTIHMTKKEMADAFAAAGFVPGMFGNKRPDIVKSKKKTNLAVGPEKNINSPNPGKTSSIIKKTRSTKRKK